MNVLWRCSDEAAQHLPIHRLLELEGLQDELFTLEDYAFDHVFYSLKADSDLETAYMACIDFLDLTRKDFSKG
jgi:hypothetical protein